MSYPRSLPLEGGRNFRDLGGYRADGGMITRWRTIFRSGTLSGLTHPDMQALDQLGIKAMFDLRTEHERIADPHPWPRATHVVVYQRDYHASGGDLVRRLEDPAFTPENARQAMSENYRHLPFEQVDAYRVMFERLADGDVPAVFNCTAGKDRTGVAAAVLLSILGVSKKQILEDYCLSNEHLTLEKLVRSSGGVPHAVDGLGDMSVLNALIDANPDYLNACFDEIQKRCGGVDVYVTSVLGLQPDIQCSLRERLLVEP